jgi:hypothetical protein
MTGKLADDRAVATELFPPKPQLGAIAASPTRRGSFTEARSEYFRDRPQNLDGVNAMTHNILPPNLCNVQHV